MPETAEAPEVETVSNVDDPVRDFGGVIAERLAATLAFLTGQVFQHLPKSSHDDFVKALKKEL